MEIKNLITYGCGDKLDIVKIKPIQNNNFVKPLGGLWSSPVNSECGWKDWCKSENFGDLNSSFIFGIKGNVLKIDSESDLEKMPWIKSTSYFEFPDFEKMMKSGIDAIWLTENGQWATRMSRPRDLYGWDCETVFVMNPKCICFGK